MTNPHTPRVFRAGLRLGLALILSGQAASTVWAQVPTFPGSTPTEPIGSINVPGLPQNAADYSVVSEVHFKYATQIPAAGDRSLALSRLAGTATFSNQLDMAEKSVIAAANAALLIPQGLVRDQRLISTVSALLDLAEVRIRDGVDNSSTTEVAARGGKKIDRFDLIRKGQVDWKLAGDLALKIQNPTYRNELMFKVADGMAAGSRPSSTTSPKPKAAGDRSRRGVLTSPIRACPTRSSSTPRHTRR